MFIIYTYWRRWKRKAGKEGEILAGKIIHQYLNDQDIILNNVEITVHGKETELDYVVINRDGVFIFEVKNYSGELEENEYDDWSKYKISSGNNEYVKEVRNPIKQVKREIYLLKELLHIYG